MKKILFTILIVCISYKGYAQKKNNKQDDFPVKKTEAEWRKKLSNKAYYVLRTKGTEYAYTGKYYKNREKGNYVCAGCNAFLYSSDNKYDSSCGWPSFDKGNNKNLGYRPDNSHGMKRIEIYCKQCGGHLGHIFNDGPVKTTGKRHCINSVSLKFIPKK